VGGSLACFWLDRGPRGRNGLDPPPADPRGWGAVFLRHRRRCFKTRTGKELRSGRACVTAREGPVTRDEAKHHRLAHRPLSGGNRPSAGADGPPDYLDRFGGSAAAASARRTAPSIAVSLVIAGDGTVFVTDSQNDRIEKFTARQLPRQVGIRVQPRGIALDGPATCTCPTPAITCDQVLEQRRLAPRFRQRGSGPGQLIFPWESRSAAKARSTWPTTATTASSASRRPAPSRCSSAGWAAETESSTARPGS